jgi:hypothetical protein
MQMTTETLFRSFEKYSNSIDTDGFSGLFAESFLAAGPQGSRHIRTSDLLQFLPTRHKALAALGCSTAHLVTFSEIPLGDRYLFVTTKWEIETIAPAGSGTITVSSSFLLEAQADSWRIIAYIAHSDIESLLTNRVAEMERRRGEKQHE